MDVGDNSTLAVNATVAAGGEEDVCSGQEEAAGTCISWFQVPNLI